MNREIAGQSGQGAREKVAREVAKRLAKMDEGVGAVKIGDFGREGGEVMRNVFLFDVYHRFSDAVDKHVVKQIKAGDSPIRAEFAEAVLDGLERRGIDRAAGGRYVSMFYQIRRAFHFIDRGLIGQSVSMKRLRESLWNNIFTHDISYYERMLWDKMEDFSTLLLGPTGSGKGAAAAAIGKSGYIGYDAAKGTFAESFTRTFLPVNLSQYAETLLESELFGHAKGAFTGAVEAHTGVFGLCRQHGSIFLDEIGEISAQAQIKLLRVLEEREFSPVGSHERVRFGGRVIAATNESLAKLRQNKGFRDDFYYRLCSDCIVVPSLAERVRENSGELEELVRHTVGAVTGEESEEIVSGVMEAIYEGVGEEYEWPGNVRELAQCVRRVIIKGRYKPEKAEGAATERDKLFRDMELGEATAQDVLRGYCAMLYGQCKNYREVSRRTGLDSRTVKRYLGEG